MSAIELLRRRRRCAAPPAKRGAHGCRVFAAAALLATAAAASGAPQAATGFTWSETSGWINFAPTGGGVIVHGDHLTGFAWSENLGWIKLGSDGGGPYANRGATDWGVNRAAGSALSGYAWSETSGWMRFDPGFSPVTLDPDSGIFDGYTWSPRVGWIHFRNADPAYGPTLPVGVAEAEVPTMGEWGLVVLALGLAAIGVSWLRRRSFPHGIELTRS